LSFASPEKENYFFYIYDVITWEKKEKSPGLNYSHWQAMAQDRTPRHTQCCFRHPSSLVLHSLLARRSCPTASLISVSAFPSACRCLEQLGMVAPRTHAHSLTLTQHTFLVCAHARARAARAARTHTQHTFYHASLAFLAKSAGREWGKGEATEEDTYS
jgi:hypothetical protein